MSRNGIIPRKRVWVSCAIVILIVATAIFDAFDLAAIQRSLFRANQGVEKTAVSNEVAIVETATLKGAETHSVAVDEHGNRTLPIGYASTGNPRASSSNASGSHRLIDTSSLLSNSSRNSSLDDFSFNSLAARKGAKPAEAHASGNSSERKVPNNVQHIKHVSSTTEKLKSTATPRVPAKPKLAPGSKTPLLARTVQPQFAGPTTTRNDSIVIPPAPVCRRRCQHFNNKVFLISPPHGAGLSDRLYIIPRMLQLSSYLCARLHLARPKFWLSAGHNQGKELDARITWDDFISYRLVDDKTNHSAWMDWVDERNVAMLPNVSNIKRSRKYRSWLYVRTDNPSNIVEHFERIESFSFSQDHQSSSASQKQSSLQQQGFLWEIRANYYNFQSLLIKNMRQRHNNITIQNNIKKLSSNWKSNMQPFGILPKNQGCSYIQGRIPSDVVRLVNNIFHRITTDRDNEPNHNDNGTAVAATPPPSPKPWIGYFHIRRGDAIATCNTTLERVERFLACSVGRPLSKLASTSKGQKQPIRKVILLVSSDERSPEYRQALARLVEKQTFFPMVNQTFSVSFADLDELGRSEIAAAIEKGEMPAWRQSNMYLFRMIMYIEWSRREIMFRLEQRRSTCPSCNSIIPQLQWKRALSDYF